MNDAILALTNSEDGVHSEVVISKLQNIGERVFRMDSDRFAGGELRVDVSVGQQFRGFSLKDEGDILNSDEIKSVWYRRPNLFSLTTKDLVQKAYGEEELRSFLAGIWLLVPERVFWVSGPDAIDRAKKKMYQLEVARMLGLPTLPTIASNDSERIRSFYDECGGKIVFKAICEEFLDYGERGFTIPTTFITPNHLAKLNLVRKLPGIFQKFVEKKYELRVTVVGDKIFPVKISPRGNPLPTIDWRHPACIRELCYSPTNLSDTISEACWKMVRELGLEFGAFDFVADEKGELSFLEINPNGQWYWLEEQAGVQISNAVVDILRYGRR